jgi:hypothetical protein
MNQPDLVPVYRIFGLGRRDHERLAGFCDFLEAGVSAESQTLILFGWCSRSLHTNGFDPAKRRGFSVVADHLSRKAECRC